MGFSLLTGNEQVISQPYSSQAKYTLAQINAATNNYERLIGKGGFGLVYYGKLSSGQEVAVKVAAKGSSQGSREFLNEVRPKSCTSIIHFGMGEW